MSAVEPLIPRKVWTRAEADLIPPGTLSLQLVNGELVDKTGKEPPHVYWTDEVRDWLMVQFGSQHVRTQDPIDVAPEDNPTNEPEPDVAVTTVSRRQTKGANPRPDQLRLVVEVSDRTYRMDTQVKAGLYARAGIPEYWVIDVRIPDRPCLVLYREPESSGYRQMTKHEYPNRITVLDGLTICLENLTTSEPRT